MPKIIFIILFFVLLLLSACSHKDQSLRLAKDFAVKYNPEQSLDTFACRIKEYYQLPAIGIGTIDKNGNRTIAVTGKNKTANGSPVNALSKFQIASCTKTFTALLVALMVSEGKITWETTLYEIFPEFEIHPLNQKINVLDLLTHTSGLAQFWTDEEVFGIDSIIPGLSGPVEMQRNKFASYNLKLPPPFKNGDYHYSNGGYVILAAMLEKITGQSYENLVKEWIFKPLQLHTAEPGYSFLNDPHQPHRHFDRDNNGVGIPLQKSEKVPPELFNPCGFISLSIEDFTKYTAHCIRLNTGQSFLLPKHISSKLFERHLSLPDGTGVGLGWQIIEVKGIKTYGHTGSDQTMRAALAINPKKEKGVVFASNIGDLRSEQALVNVIHELVN